MPKRWNPSERVWVYRYLCLRDGEECRRCRKTPPETPQKRLDIHHVDGNPKNNNAENLCLVCHACNTVLERSRVTENPEISHPQLALEPQLPPDTPEEPPPGGVSVRERDRTDVLKQAVNYKEGSPEMQVAFLCEISFREWVMKELQEKGGMSSKGAITSGAEVVGCSIETTQRYLMKLTSEAGPLAEVRDMLGDKCIMIKTYRQNGGPPR